MDLGLYGNTVIHTPNLDALAATGTAFTSAYTHVSSCSPSRSALLSGLPSHQNGMYGLQHSLNHFAAFDHVQSIPNILNDAGYVTGIIGKYHVWPANDFNFTWGNSPDGPGGCQAGASSACPNTDYNLVARNITYMVHQAHLFLEYANSQHKPWFLYVGFGDSHRCGGHIGEFCQFYGFDNKTKQSTIPDWQPMFYSPADVLVPYWIQDTPAARGDLAGMYTAKNRMDQGVGLMLRELQAHGAQVNSTLVIYMADNGAPFPAGKTNFYQPGAVEPLVMHIPGQAGGSHCDELVTTLDILPTILDWAGVPLPKYNLNGVQVAFTGRSLLSVGLSPRPAVAHAWKHPALMSLSEAQALQLPRESPPPPLPANYSRIHHSFQLHEVQEYYPMRSVHARVANTTYHLIYNIAHFLPYPIAADLWTAPAFQDLLSRTQQGQPTYWYRNFSSYLNTPRPRYELYDLETDPMELVNVVDNSDYAAIAAALQEELRNYQVATNDQWVIKYSHE